MDVVDGVLTRAEADPDVLGVILTGSHARGLATVHSDHDLTIVVHEQDVPYRHRTRNADLDEVVCTLEALARERGHSDVLDGWADDLRLIRAGRSTMDGPAPTG